MSEMTVSLGYRIGVSNNGQLVDGIYPVMINESGEIIAIFKYLSTPRNPGNMEGFLQELKAYCEAPNYSTFDRDKFGCWNYFDINGWEDQIVSDAQLNEMLLSRPKNHL